jgi:hypothetical protein
LRRLSLAHRAELRSTGPILARALAELVDTGGPRAANTSRKA